MIDRGSLQSEIFTYAPPQSAPPRRPSIQRMDILYAFSLNGIDILSGGAEKARAVGKSTAGRHVRYGRRRADVAARGHPGA
jgi:hypothetical protein